MAAPMKSHVPVEGLKVELVIGSYYQVLYGYELKESNNKVELDVSFTNNTHCGSVRSLAVSSNKLLASGSTDENIQLFDLKSRYEAGTLMKHSGTITDIEFYNEFMISCDDSGIICIWKVLGKSFECMKTLSGHKGSVSSLSVHPSGKILLSVGQDKTLRTWNLVTAKRAYTTNTPSMIDIVRWSPDGEKYILCYNGKIDICSMAKAASLHTIKLPGRGHSLDFVFSEIFAVGCENGLLVFVNVNSGVIIHEYKTASNRIKCVSAHELDDCKSLLALATNDGVVELLLISQNHGKVSTSLIAATKHDLRPICLQLIVNTYEESKEEKPALVSTGCEKAVEKVADKELDTSIDDQNDVAVMVKSKVGKKRKKSHPEEDMSDHCMDKIKKMIGGKGKDSKSDADPVHNKHKKHMKPVDSVKITKQKFSNPKKQHAKHHDQHIAEESD